MVCLNSSQQGSHGVSFCQSKEHVGREAEEEEEEAAMAEAQGRDGWLYGDAQTHTEPRTVSVMLHAKQLVTKCASASWADLLLSPPLSHVPRAWPCVSRYEPCVGAGDDHRQPAPQLLRPPASVEQLRGLRAAASPCVHRNFPSRPQTHGRFPRCLFGRGKKGRRQPWRKHGG